MKNKKVIYTSMFGVDGNAEFFLHEPLCEMDGWDFICFTDNDKITSDKWTVKLVTPFYSDGARDNRRFKILPHRHLKDYDISVCVDGDIQITKDINDIVDTYLSEYNFAVLDHKLCGVSTTGTLNSRNCIYQEAQFIQWLGDNHPRKKYKDNMDIIHKQVNQYKQNGYPENNGLARTTIIFRRHNDLEVIKNMEDWWTEYKYNSRRDQLSLPYVIWKNKFKFKYIDIDIDDNEYFKLMKKWRQMKSKEIKKNHIDYEPISFDYFMNMELSSGGGGKEIINQNHTLKKVKDIVEFFSINKNVKNIRETLNKDNWQYFNCMIAEFRKNVGDHHKMGWKNMTEDYYKSLDLMSDDELQTFLKNSPVEFDNGFIRHSWHRACAMIGRLINGKKYIPFYMIKSEIYDSSRTKDRIHRIKSLTKNLNGLSFITGANILKNDFTICQSGILSLMGIRQNDDLDIIISSKARNKIFNGNNGFMKLNGGIEIFEKNRGKFRIFGAQGDDDLIDNYSFQVDGYNFLEPRFYFSRKHRDKQQRDIDDWNGIREFFERENHKGYPFNKLSEEQLGKQFV